MFALVFLMLLDKAGRRKFLLAGSIVMAVCLLCLGIVTLSTNSQYFTDPCTDVTPLSVPSNSSTLPANGISTGSQANHSTTHIPPSSSVRPPAAAVEDITDNNYKANNSVILNDSGGKIIDEVTEATTSTRLRIRRDVEEVEGGPTGNATTSADNPVVKWVSLLALFGYVGGYQMGFGLCKPMPTR